jgi:hypothetical protein
METMIEMNRQAVEGDMDEMEDAIEEAINNLNELNRERQAFVENAWQQMMVQFLQEQANGGGDAFEMVGRGIDNLVREGMHLVSHLQFISDTPRKLNRFLKDNCLVTL